MKLSIFLSAWCFLCACSYANELSLEDAREKVAAILNAASVEESAVLLSAGDRDGLPTGEALEDFNNALRKSVILYRSEVIPVILTQSYENALFVCDVIVYDRETDVEDNRVRSLYTFVKEEAEWRFEGPVIKYSLQSYMAKLKSLLDS